MKTQGGMSSWEYKIPVKDNQKKKQICGVQTAKNNPTEKKLWSLESTGASAPPSTTANQSGALFPARASGTKACSIISASTFADERRSHEGAGAKMTCK